MLGKRSDESAMLYRGHCNCSRPDQDERETEDLRRKGLGSRRARRRLQGNKVKEEAEPRNNKPETDDRDSGSYPCEEGALGGKEDTWVRGRH